jgi:nicotinamidase-related amidase
MRQEDCSMLTAGKTVLLVVDFQDSLLAKILEADRVVDRSVKMIRAADALDMPVVFTEQYRKGLGPTTGRIADEFRARPVFDKTSFGCFGDSAFAEHMAQSDRRQLLIVGVEAHVCVMQTALQAMSLGYEPFVARDAVSSRGETDLAAGLDRMAAEGVRLVTVEMAIFELLRAAGTPEFKKMLPIIK